MDFRHKWEKVLSIVGTNATWKVAHDFIDTRNTIWNHTIVTPFLSANLNPIENFGQYPLTLCRALARAPKS